MIRRLNDRDSLDGDTGRRVLERRLAETDEMIRLAERQCAEDPDSFASSLELRSFRNRREKILEELEEVRSRNG